MIHGEFVKSYSDRTDEKYHGLAMIERGEIRKNYSPPFRDTKCIPFYDK